MSRLLSIAQRICVPRKLPLPLRIPARAIATHVNNHHASSLSVMPTSVDKSSAVFRDNATQMGEVMARMQELHQTIEYGGPAKAKDKHIARGKMLPREYVSGER